MKQGVLVVLGHKGSGKSQLTRCFLDAVPRSICIDTMAEYGGVVIEDPHSLAAYLEANKHLERFRVSYRDAGNQGIPPELVFKMLQNLRDVWICLEEASKWGTANTMLDEVRWFLQYGRHNRISVLLVARRPQEIDRMGTAQADTVVSFVQHEPRDLEYIRKLGGEDAEKRIAALGEFEWDYVVDQHAEIAAVLDSVCEGSGFEPEPEPDPEPEPEPEPVPVEPAGGEPVPAAVVPAQASEPPAVAAVPASRPAGRRRRKARR
jgi:energy-coupling factor transporter ATP-binding protein EcfA2